MTFECLTIYVGLCLMRDGVDAILGDCETASEYDQMADLACAVLARFTQLVEARPKEGE